MARRITCALALAGALTLPQGWALAAPAGAPLPDPGNNGWMMTATVLVLLMIVPGLALFYGGMTRAKNLLSMMTQVAAAAAMAMLVWFAWGYAMTFGGDGNAFFSWGRPFLAGISVESTVPTFTEAVISEYVFVSFQMTFAAITAALIFGASAERLKFSSVLLFTPIWLTLVYFPIAHMVWASGGLLFEDGALDFAGGTVVHINAGVSGLVLAAQVGRRRGYPQEPMPPHSLALTMTGTGLLWVGWFGFNAGSALEANGFAALAMINTFLATAAGALGWMAIERLRGHRPSALGFCSGVIAGLVAVTPAAGNAGPAGAIALGLLSSAVCYWAVASLKRRLGYDDALDAFGIHGVGGIVGALGTALAYQPYFGGPGDGSVALGSQLLIQAYGVALTIAWAALGTGIAAWAVKMLIGLRVSEEKEIEGLDLTEHGERAYN